MCDIILDQGGLAGERHQLGMKRGMKNRLREPRDGLEGRREIDLLEGAGPQDLDVDLPGQRENRRTVDLGVPKPAMRLVAPGPAIVRHAAGRPVSLPYPEHAKAAAPSWRTPT